MSECPWLKGKEMDLLDRMHSAICSKTGFLGAFLIPGAKLLQERVLEKANVAPRPGYASAAVYEIMTAMLYAVPIEILLNYNKIF